MDNKKLRIVLACLALALALTGVVLAQVSGNFDLSWNFIGSGGGQRESANYQVDDSLGLVAVGTSNSAGYGVSAGFWNAATPGVFITPTAVILRPGQTQAFEASGGIGSYSWGATGGVVSPTTGALVTYTAGETRGDYSVIVTSGDAQARADVTIAGLDITALAATQLDINDTLLFEITNPGDNTPPFSWLSTDTEVGTILPVGGGTQGELTAKAVGVTQVYARDDAGVESNRIQVIVGNTVEIPRVVGEAGKPVVVHVNANTSFAEEISSLQMTIGFDPSLLQAQQTKVTYRTAHFSLGASVDNTGGSVTILLTSLTGEKIAAGSGPILDLVFNVDAGASNGATSPLTFSGVELAPLFGSSIPVTALNGEFEVCPSCLIHDGDVSQDGNVSIIDLQMAINIYLQRYTPNSEEFAAADMAPQPTGDEAVNVVDVLKILNKILGKPVAAQVLAEGRDIQRTLDSHAPVQLTVPDRIAAEAGEALIIPVLMNNEVPVGGLDLTLVYTEVVDLLPTTPSVSSPRGGHMALEVNADNPSSLPIILRSPDTVQVIPAGNGTLFSVNFGTVSQAVDGKLTVAEAAVSDASGNALAFTFEGPEEFEVYLPLVVRGQ